MWVSKEQCHQIQISDTLCAKMKRESAENTMKACEARRLDFIYDPKHCVSRQSDTQTTILLIFCNIAHVIARNLGQAVFLGEHHRALLHGCIHKQLPSGFFCSGYLHVPSSLDISVSWLLCDSSLLVWPQSHFCAFKSLCCFRLPCCIIDLNESPLGLHSGQVRLLPVSGSVRKTVKK